MLSSMLQCCSASSLLQYTVLCFALLCFAMRCILSNFMSHYCVVISNTIQATAYGLTEDTLTTTATTSFLPLIQKHRYSHDGYLIDSFNEHVDSTTAAATTASVGCQTVDASSGSSNCWSFGNGSSKGALRQRLRNGCANGSVTDGSVTGSCVTAVTDRTVRSVRSLARGTCATGSLWAE
jgi:hypothetical protein